MLLAHLDERLGDVAPRVVDEDVERRECRDCLPHFARPGDIADHCMRFAARGADLGRGGFDLLARARREPDFRARLRERDGARATDAASGAGDEGGTVIETETVDHFSLMRLRTSARSSSASLVRSSASRVLGVLASYSTLLRRS